MKIPVPSSVDKSRYVINGESNGLERFYGLPGSVEFCSNCVFSNQKPNSEQEYKHTLKTQKPTLSFNDEGICSACLVAKNKRDIDWAEREAKLKTLCDIIGAETVAMIVWFLVPAVKTVSMQHIS